MEIKINLDAVPETPNVRVRVSIQSISVKFSVDQIFPKNRLNELPTILETWVGHHSDEWLKEELDA